MSVFDDRDRAFATDWARNADDRLRHRARRNRLLAEWAAEAAGLSGEDAAAEVRRLVKCDFDPRGEAAFFEAVAETAGVDAAAVRARAEELSGGAD